MNAITKKKPAEGYIPRRSFKPLPKDIPQLDPSEWEGAYGLIMSGSCLEPHLPDGSAVLCDTRVPPKPGDIVVVRLHAGANLLQQRSQQVVRAVPKHLHADAEQQKRRQAHDDRRSGRADAPTDALGLAVEDVDHEADESGRDGGRGHERQQAFHARAAARAERDRDRDRSRSRGERHGEGIERQLAR